MAGYTSVYILNEIPEESESSHNAIEYSHAVAHMKGVASHLPANQTQTDITSILYHSISLQRTGAQSTLPEKKKHERIPGNDRMHLSSQSYSGYVEGVVSAL